MRIIDAHFFIESPLPTIEHGVSILKDLEEYGRVCYKSEGKITPDSYKTFLTKLSKLEHNSVLEHKSVTVRIICDRGITHEIVRHRIGAYSQESTRYCNYHPDKTAGEGLKVINLRPGLDVEDKIKLSCDKDDLQKVWAEAMENAQKSYNLMLKFGASAQMARSVLPNSTKTEIVVTYNLRQWQHFFRLRTSPKAHPQMREIAIPILNRFRTFIPIIFDEQWITGKKEN